jgi:DNA-binding NtrC family response regulator
MTSPSRRILVVDDDRAMLRTLSDVLRIAGWQTETAGSGEEAIESLAKSSYAAVLMDVRMGGMSGVAALQAMRDRWPTLPVLLMTAYASPEMLRDAAAAGAPRVLRKPVPIPDLLDALAAVAGSRGALLLVDDDPDFRRSLTAVLTGRGFAVRQAASLSDAISSLQRTPAVAVILDLQIDDTQPHDLLDAIKRVRSDTAIILCTGYPHLLESLVSSGLPDRVLGYVVKPFAADKLTALIETAVR